MLKGSLKPLKGELAAPSVPIRAESLLHLIHGAQESTDEDATAVLLVAEVPRGDRPATVEGFQVLGGCERGTGKWHPFWCPFR